MNDSTPVRKSNEAARRVAGTFQLYSSKTTQDIHQFPTQCLLKTLNNVNANEDGGIRACAELECLADILGNCRFVVTISKMRTSAHWVITSPPYTNLSPKNLSNTSRVGIYASNGGFAKTTMGGIS
ncbi:hypothetical protein ARMGADRAFT_1017082 [Armillaria gallica]|uniref:Uncharacterized protein n=1 Tax=Armillaria gallica TaxID=47427 RepID=A0A2H3D6L2_ARMGA|nr:hypothetical protein ARMGADRAFT_1017082 [Armillaria gallica]